MTKSAPPTRALQRAGYKCQAPEYPSGPRCALPAGKVDRATGVVVCNAHLSHTSAK